MNFTFFVTFFGGNFQEFLVMRMAFRFHYNFEFFGNRVVFFWLSKPVHNVFSEIFSGLFILYFLWRISKLIFLSRLLLVHWFLLLVDFILQINVVNMVLLKISLKLIKFLFHLGHFGLLPSRWLTVETFCLSLSLCVTLCVCVCLALSLFLSLFLSVPWRLSARTSY